MTTETHPSYGAISVDRIQCSSGIGVFGSKIKHNNLVEITISTAELNRELNNDYIFPDVPLIKIEMSEAQWAHLICSMNTGSTPCTLEYTKETGRIEPKEYVSPKEKMIKDFNEDIIEGSKELVKEAEEAASEIEDRSVSMTKSKRTELSSKIRKLVRMFNDHLPFMTRQFQEQMEQAETEATAEMEATATKIVTNLGKEALATKISNNDNPLIAITSSKED